MAALEWNYEYSIGVRELDNQHKQLIHLLNQSHYGKIADASIADHDITLIELMDYAAFHLKYEAQWLVKNGHAALCEGHKGNENLRKKVIRIQNYYFKAGKLDSERILSFMKRWIVNHIAEAKVSFYDLASGKDVA